MSVSIPSATIALATTPTDRLGLYAFLLGACGGADDAALLRSLLQNPSERVLPAFDGLLGGYIHLRPQEGWDLALETLRDEKQPFPVRFAALRMLRFYPQIFSLFVGFENGDFFTAAHVAGQSLLHAGDCESSVGELFWRRAGGSGR